jgi:ParB family chromosome partitioning protein
MAKPALGRGLGALLGGNPPGATVLSDSPALPGSPAGLRSLTGPAEPGERVQRVPLGRIRPCPFQPRKDFPAGSLQELAESIRAQGIVQPLIVRTKADHFELIAGERRWRAAQLVSLAEVPVVVREADDRTVLELALIENLQRENLNPIEEAQGYAQLMEQFNLGQEEVSVKVGKARASVANALRLLKLPADVQAHVRDGRLSVGHAKVILGLPGTDLQRLAAERVLKESLNVRQAEELVAHLQAVHERRVSGTATHKPAASKDVHVLDLEEKLKQRLGTKVTLRYRQGKGALEVKFFSDEELERLLDLLGVKLN